MCGGKIDETLNPCLLGRPQQPQGPPTIDIQSQKRFMERIDFVHCSQVDDGINIPAGCIDRSLLQKVQGNNFSAVQPLRRWSVAVSGTQKNSQISGRGQVMGNPPAQISKAASDQHPIHSTPPAARYKGSCHRRLRVYPLQQDRAARLHNWPAGSRRVPAPGTHSRPVGVSLSVYRPLPR